MYLSRGAGEGICDDRPGGRVTEAAVDTRALGAAGASGKGGAQEADNLQAILLAPRRPGEERRTEATQASTVPGY